MKVSAKEGRNIEDLFRQIGEKIFAEFGAVN